MERITTDRGRIMSNRLRLHDEALMLRGARLLAEAVSAGVRIENLQ